MTIVVCLSHCTHTGAAFPPMITYVYGQDKEDFFFSCFAVATAIEGARRYARYIPPGGLLVSLAILRTHPSCRPHPEFAAVFKILEQSANLMGASESSFWPPSPQQQKTGSPSEENHSNEAATIPSDYDPRSPNSAIQRTPIRMKVANQVPADPRSPSSDFQRTPLRNLQGKGSSNPAHALFTEKEEQQRKISSTSS